MVKCSFMWRPRTFARLACRKLGPRSAKRERGLRREPIGPYVCQVYIPRVPCRCPRRVAQKRPVDLPEISEGVRPSSRSIARGLPRNVPGLGQVVPRFTPAATQYTVHHEAFAKHFLRSSPKVPNHSPGVSQCICPRHPQDFPKPYRCFSLDSRRGFPCGCGLTPPLPTPTHARVPASMPRRCLQAFANHPLRLSNIFAICATDHPWHDTADVPRD